MFLVVGLGNPGPKYRGNRHNVGFRVVDQLAAKAGAELREKFKALHARARVAGSDAVLLEPMTFMNLSGESVQPAMQFFKVPLDEVVVVHDELDLPFGTVRLKKGGGAAGHNGLRSIIQHCGPDFVRVRIGIGRPAQGAPENWVLSDFSGPESAELSGVLDEAAHAVEAVIGNGLTAAMNAVNPRNKN